MPLTLLQRVADGDAAAVDECLSQYGGLVWSLARRMCPRHEDAEDAVQEIFIELWRKAENYEPDIASEATYITTIARRRLIDRYRRRSRDLDTTSIADDVVVDHVEHEKWIEVSEEAAHARKHMRQLRPEEQQVLELSINDGMSQSQVAEAMNLPLGTVKTHARRGLIRLRELLGVSEVGGAKGAGA
ncbi:MAG: sigma-70 family RNA polymerase sigma factor [Pirellulaceae bacterium]|nr:sigma-70 family RNA polymerase sigma factor [Pirellulaceae bacterium]